MAVSVSYGQEISCERMYRQAIEYARGGNYRLALNKLNAAKICNPQEKKYDRLIISIYDSINLQKTIATDAKQIAETALKNEKEARKLSEKRLASFLFKSAVYDFADKGNFIESYVLLSQAAAKDPGNISVREMISQLIPLLSDTMISNVSFTKKLDWGPNSYQLLVQKVAQKTEFELEERLKSGVRLESGIKYINEGDDRNDKYQLKIGKSINDKFTVVDFDTISCKTSQFWAYISGDALIVFSDNDLWAYSRNPASPKPTLKYHLVHNLYDYATRSQFYYNSGPERQTFVMKTQLRLMNDGYALVFADHRMTVVSLETRRTVIDFGLPEKDHYTDILNIRFLPSSQLVVQFTKRTAPENQRWTQTDPAVNIYEIPSGKLLHHFEGYEFDDPYEVIRSQVTGMPEIDASENAGFIGLTQSRQRANHANSMSNLSDSISLLYNSFTQETFLLGKAFGRIGSGKFRDWGFSITDNYIFMSAIEKSGRRKLLIFDKHFSFVKELDDIGIYKFFKGAESIVYELPVKIPDSAQPSPFEHISNDTLAVYLIAKDSLFYVSSGNFFNNTNNKEIVLLKNGRHWNAYDRNFSFAIPILAVTEDEKKGFGSRQLNVVIIWFWTESTRYDTVNGYPDAAHKHVTYHNYFYSVKEHKILFQNDENIDFIESADNCLYYLNGANRNKTIYRLNFTNQRKDSVSGPVGFAEPVKKIALYKDIILINPSTFYALRNLTRTETSVYPSWIKDVFLVYNTSIKKMDTLFLPVSFNSYDAPFSKEVDSASFASFLKNEHLLGNYLILYGVASLQRSNTGDPFRDPSKNSLFYAINLNTKISRQQYYRKKFSRSITGQR